MGSRVGVMGREGKLVMSGDPSEVEQQFAEVAAVPVEEPAGSTVEEIDELAEVELHETVVAVVVVERPASNGLEGDVGLEIVVEDLVTCSVDSKGVVGSAHEHLEVGFERMAS